MSVIWGKPHGKLLIDGVDSSPRLSCHALQLVTLNPTKDAIVIAKTSIRDH